MALNGFYLIFMTNTSPLNAIVLAAGAGTRMKSDLPKILHKVAGKAMIDHLLDQVASLNANTYLIYGYKGEVLQAALEQRNLNWVYQDQQLGTAHATKLAADLLTDDAPTLVMFSDNPLLTAKTLDNLRQLMAREDAGIALVSTVVDNPFGYGRVVRDVTGNITSIVEQKDCTPEQAAIKEIFPGTLIARAQNLKQLLAKVDNNNAAREYYLTDIIRLAYAQGQKVVSLITDPREVAAANTKYQIAQLEDLYQERKLQEYAEAGLIIRSARAGTFRVEGELSFGVDCVVDLNCQFIGKVELGNNVTIGQGCIIKNSKIGDNSHIEPYSVIEDSEIGVSCAIGPFARLRPKSRIYDKAKVGNFVETKNISLGEDSKASHLTYLGDAEIGSNVNIGAGVITCNYDGANKFKTIIGNNVFVGSDCQLVAPIRVANGATIAAGTTVVKNIDSPDLVLNKKETVVRKDWERPIKL